MINSRHQGTPLRFLFRFYVPSTSIVRKYGVLTKGDKTFWTIPSASSTYLHKTHTHIHTFTPSPHGLNVLATGKIRYKSRVVYHLTKHSRFSPRPEVESLFYYPPPLHPPPHKRRRAL